MTMRVIHCLPGGREKMLMSVHGKYVMDLTYEVMGGHTYHWEQYIAPVLSIGVYKFAQLEYPGCVFYNEGTFKGASTELLKEAQAFLDGVAKENAAILDGKKVWEVIPTNVGNKVIIARRDGGRDEYVYRHNTLDGPLMCVHLKYDVKGKCYWKQQHVAYDVVQL